MPELKHLDVLDYVVVGAYLVMVLVTGFYVSRFNKQSSDYFKGGGHVPWGLSAVSLFISGFSAFMFVGAAGVTYQNGGGALLLFTLAGPAYLLGYFIYGPLWRRTRIDTPMQFLNRRFSPGTTYFYTLLAVIPNVLILGTMIYTLCIFVSTALGFNALTFNLGIISVNGFELSMLVIGCVIVIYTMMGGLWAVMVTDGLQFLILLLVTLVMLPLSYAVLGHGNIIDGVSRLAHDAPDRYFAINLVGRKPIFWAAYIANTMMGYNVNWHIAQRYYSVPDERDTKKMALWCSILGVILPLMWILPVMTTKVLFPALETMWPELAKPSEASFVTLALAILPHGMLGVMVAAILAATMSSADTTFNWLAAVLTKDAYAPMFKAAKGREPSEKTQLLFGKLSVATMGVIAIWIALNMGKYGGAFDVYLRAGSLYNPPMFIPVMLGLIYTRTPWWSGMASFGAGVLAILIVSAVANASQGIPVDSFAAMFSPINVSVFGIAMDRYVMNTLTGIGVSSATFFVSALFKKRQGAFADRIGSLERDLATPAHASGALDVRGGQVYMFTGRVAILIGGLLMLLAIPTAGAGGELNIVTGALSIGLGIIVIYLTRRLQHRYGPETQASE